MKPSQDAQPMQQHADDGINPLALLSILLDYKWLVVVVTILFAMLGIAYALLAAPIYRADALIQIENKKAAIAGLSDISDLTGKESEAVTEIELIKSRWVIGKAVDSLALEIIAYPRHFPLIGGYIARHFSPIKEGDVASSSLPFAAGYDWGGAQIHVTQLDLPDNLLGKPLTLVASSDGAYTLNIEKQMLLQGKVGMQANSNGIVMQVERLYAKPGTEFTVSKKPRLATVDEFRKQLVVVEHGKKSGMIGLSLENADPVFASKVLNEFAQMYIRQNVERMSAEAANSLQFLREQLPQVRQEMESAEAAFNKYQVSAKSVDISAETASVLEQIVKLDETLSELKLKQVEMDTRFTHEHPAYQTLLGQVSELNAKKKELEQKVANLPETQQELLRLTRDVQVNTQIYTQMLNKAQELDIVRAGTVGNARIIDYAEVDAAHPVKPQRGLMVVVATLLGAIVAIVVTYLHSLLTRGIESPAEIEALGLPVNASIPYSALQIESEKKIGKGQALSLLALAHPTDPAIEAIRSLRTSLHFIMQEAPNNIVMISGPSPLVGKTFVSANLAVTMAQAGKNVLLIDADMRKGYVHKFFNVDSKQHGLSNLLQKKSTVAEAIVATSVKDLSFIARGAVPENPSELLLNKSFAQLLKHVSTTFDLVIIDTPPILAVADALIVSKLAGANFLIARFSKNPVGEVQAAIKRFEHNGIKLNGAILNAVQKRSLDDYRYQKYGYGYYQYNYSSEKRAADDASSEN